MGNDERKQRYRPVGDAHRSPAVWPSRRALAFVLLGVAALLVVVWWRLGGPSRSGPGPLGITARPEVLKFGLALVAELGGVIAFVIGDHVERVQTHAQYDQAVGQLRHGRAAVRLEGLDALERIAQAHSCHRQAVVDVVCAYLCGPFRPVASIAVRRDPSRPVPESDVVQRELQVRLTAQRLLHRHLAITPDQPHPLTYWDDIHICLTGAYLVDFDFTRCRPARATFTNAHFSGDAEFDGARFEGEARFDGVRFSGNAGFDGTCFHRDARFEKARFDADAWLGGARFHGNARFEGARFGGVAWFSGARFDADAGFEGARFGGDTWFREARFEGNARFHEARFDHVPNLTDATAGRPDGDHVWPAPWHTEAVTFRTARLIRRD